jgi:Mce-associated membrane protein
VSDRHRLPKSAAKATDSTSEQETEAVEVTETTAPEEKGTEEKAPEEPEEPGEKATDESTDEKVTEAKPDTPKRRINWARVAVFGVLPALALLLAGAAGYLKWVDNSVRDAELARIESVQVAKDSTVAMLSYKPDTVEQQLNDARSLLTGDFEESYTGLINDVVIPGAKEKQISAVASVPAAASVSATPNEAVVLVFVNQTVVVGQDAPTDTASSVRVTLEKIDGRWLISKFDPV